VGSVLGSATSNVSIYNSVFQSGTGGGIVGSSTVITLGGVVYVGSANIVEVNNSTFQQISGVGSGGGLYISSAVVAEIKNSVYNEIVATVSGGFSFYLFFF
jgi:hypothetical protein